MEEPVDKFVARLRRLTIESLRPSAPSRLYSQPPPGAGPMPIVAALPARDRPDLRLRRRPRRAVAVVVAGGDAELGERLLGQRLVGRAGGGLARAHLAAGDVRRRILARRAREDRAQEDEDEHERQTGKADADTFTLLHAAELSIPASFRDGKVTEGTRLVEPRREAAGGAWLKTA